MKTWKEQSYGTMIIFKLVLNILNVMKRTASIYTCVWPSLTKKFLYEIISNYFNSKYLENLFECLLNYIIDKQWMNCIHVNEKGHSWMNFIHDDDNDIGHDVGNGVDDDVNELLWDVIYDNNYIQCQL